MMFIRSQVLTGDHHQESGSDQEELIRSQVLRNDVHQESGPHGEIIIRSQILTNMGSSGVSFFHQELVQFDVYIFILF